MAFRRKDIKKSSYYVWFLGAKEAEGLRGDEFILPVLRYLIDQEGLSEVSKVTLQVSNKGLKIIQNVPKKSSPSSSSSVKLSLLSSSSSSTSSSQATGSSGKTEQIKHLIPHNAITCVVQEEDLVACILLIYNPITKCPVHVHAYRCDSIETASSLRGQLQLLIEKPENQRKFREIESRLVSKGLTVNPQSHHQFQPHQQQINQHQETDLTRKFSPLGKRCSPENRSTRTESSSDRTEDSFDSGLNGNYGSKEGKSLPLELTLGNPKVAILYESLAAELKAKLSNPKSGPILLPPKDYDTISRKQGKLTGIAARKSTNLSIVGPLEISSSTSTSTSSSSPKLLNGIVKGDKKSGLIVGKASSLSTSSSSTSSPSVLKKSMVNLPPPSTVLQTKSSSNHCLRSESSCKSSSGIGSDEPDQLSTSPFNNGKSLIKTPINKIGGGIITNSKYTGDISSDDSERNWSPIESGGPSSSGSASSSGPSSRQRLTPNSNNTNNCNQTKITMITTSSNNKNHLIHHHLSHNNNNNNININNTHKAVEKIESNRLSNSHHHQLSSSSSLSSSPSSTTNRVSIPPPVIPKTTLITATPIKTDLRKVKTDLRPVITGVTPHSIQSPSSLGSIIKESNKLSSLPVTINSSNHNHNNNNNNNNIKGKIDPPRYYFPDQIVTTNNHNGQLKHHQQPSNDSHNYRRQSTNHHDHHSESVIKSPSNGINNIINITNQCSRLKPTTRDFIRIQPLANYQRSPISY